MELESIGTVIAERTYQLEGGGNVLVRVGMPVLFPEGGNHYCPFEIDGLYADTMISRAGGVDSVQALVLALQRIRIILEHSEVPVLGLDEHDGTFGLPPPHRGLDMIKSLETAARVDELVREAAKNLIQSVQAVHETEDEVVFKQYRRRAAPLVAGVYEYILHDLWVAFPDLEPEDMRRSSGPKGGPTAEAT